MTTAQWASSIPGSGARQLNIPLTSLPARYSKSQGRAGLRTVREGGDKGAGQWGEKTIRVLWCCVGANGQPLAARLPHVREGGVGGYLDPRARQASQSFYLVAPATSSPPPLHPASFRLTSPEPEFITLVPDPIHQVSILLDCASLVAANHSHRERKTGNITRKSSKLKTTPKHPDLDPVHLTPSSRTPGFVG